MTLSQRMGLSLALVPDSLMSLGIKTDLVLYVQCKHLEPPTPSLLAVASCVEIVWPILSSELVGSEFSNNSPCPKYSIFPQSTMPSRLSF